jgi:hypothetical protein
MLYNKHQMCLAEGAIESYDKLDQLLLLSNIGHIN